MRTLDASNVDELTALARNLVRSKRVAFVVGAGISTASGIPDFRSATTGLFATLRERNPDVKLASGKDLFHSNLFQVSSFSSHSPSPASQPLAASVVRALEGAGGFTVV